MLRQNLNAIRMIFAVATLVAMVTAPLCAPLCAAGVCASSESQTSNCHDGAAVANTGGLESRVGAAADCNLSQLPVAKLNDGPKRLNRQNEQATTLVQHEHSSPAAIVEAASCRGSWHGNGGPPDPSGGATSAVLRI
jgi:hypothetical protein